MALITAAFALTAILSLTFLFERKKVFVNPAFYFWLVLAYGCLLKISFVYCCYAPRFNPADRVLVFERDLDFVWGGISLLAVGIGAYLVGTLSQISARRFVLSEQPEMPTEKTIFEMKGALPSFYSILILTIGCGIAFLAFLFVGDHSVLTGEISTKRFLTVDTGASRFTLPEYYAFKVGLLSLPLAVFALWRALLANSHERKLHWLFLVVLLFAAFITMFASMRMGFILLAFQLLLVVIFSPKRIKRNYILLVFVITILHFAATTFLRNPDKLDSLAGLANYEQPDGLETFEPAFPKIAALVDNTRTGRMIKKVITGRYFDDVFKIAHISGHFPGVEGFSGSIASAPHAVAIPEKLSCMRSRCFGSFKEWRPLWTTRSDAKPGDIVNLPTPKFLATYVFFEPGNGVTPGLTGSLFIGYGILGVVVGFFFLGFVHRILFDWVQRYTLMDLRKVAVIIAFPSLTLLIANSNLVSVLARVVSDTIVIFAGLILAQVISRYIGRAKLEPE